MSEAGSQRWQIECAVLIPAALFAYLKMRPPSVFNGDFSVLYARWRSAGFFYVDELVAPNSARWRNLSGFFYVDELVDPSFGLICDADREIYIRDIPVYDYSEGELHECLWEFPGVDQVNLLRDPVSKALTGCGYVRFATHAGAKECLDICRPPISVSYTHLTLPTNREV